ncbi:MAG TPA: cell division protein FtsH, partial [Sulfurovum sp.]|nr:cell division protein FtsH [Sulfurovum sp.]
MNNKNNNNDNNNDNNNFFNDNPLLAFAIFSIVIIMVFKTIVGDNGGGINDFMGGQGKVLKTESVKYSDIKRLIREDDVSLVKITKGSIEAVDKSGNIRYVSQNVP